MRSPCVEAGLIPPLVQLLHSKDHEVLLQTGRALGNICYDSRKYTLSYVSLTRFSPGGKGPGIGVNGFHHQHFQIDFYFIFIYIFFYMGRSLY